jgi:hypothetical protein
MNKFTTFNGKIDGKQERFSLEWESDDVYVFEPSKGGVFVTVEGKTLLDAKPIRIFWATDEIDHNTDWDAIDWLNPNKVEFLA